MDLSQGDSAFLTQIRKTATLQEGKKTNKQKHSKNSILNKPRNEKQNDFPARKYITLFYSKYTSSNT